MKHARDLDHAKEIEHDRRELVLDRLVSYLRWTLKVNLKEHEARAHARELLRITEGK